jgi:hypothetical protein
LIDNCSNYTNKLLVLYGKEEENNTNVTMELNVHFTVWNIDKSTSQNINFAFRNAQKYELCIATNATVYVDAIMDRVAILRPYIQFKLK